MVYFSNYSSAPLTPFGRLLYGYDMYGSRSSRRERNNGGEDVSGGEKRAKRRKNSIPVHVCIFNCPMIVFFFFGCVRCSISQAPMIFPP
jgi:hypothetical protein